MLGFDRMQRARPGCARRFAGVACEVVPGRLSQAWITWSRVPSATRSSRVYVSPYRWSRAARLSSLGAGDDSVQLDVPPVGVEVHSAPTGFHFVDVPGR